MRIESCSSIMRAQMLHLATPRVNKFGEASMALTNAMLLEEFSWEVAEVFSSELVVDALLFETLMHEHGEHALGRGGHLWQKTGGGTPLLDETKKHGVGVLYKLGGWLAAGGKILLKDKYRDRYLRELQDKGVALPAWAEALLEGSASSSSASSSSASSIFR